MTSEQQDHYVEALEAHFMVLATQLVIAAAAVDVRVEVSEYDSVVQGLRHMASTSPNQQTRDAAREALALIERISRDALTPQA